MPVCSHAILSRMEQQKVIAISRADLLNFRGNMGLCAPKYPRFNAGGYVRCEKVLARPYLATSIPLRMPVTVAELIRVACPRTGPAIGGINRYLS